MKKTKKTRAKLRSNERILGERVPDSMLNQKRLKNILKAKKRSKK